MFTWTVELLPLFVVRWMAKRYLERLPLYDYVVVLARRDVLFIVEYGVKSGRTD